MTEMRARLVDKDGNPLGTASNPLKISGDVGGGVPDGGTTGQVLQKKSDADQDVEWGDCSGASTAWGSITGTLSDQTDLGNVLDGKATRTDSDLTLYVYEDATGTGDGSSKANGFTTLQAAIDAIPDVAQNVTIIVCKGSTNYLGQTTTIQKASVKSLTIRGEFYAYEACDTNAVAGKVVDASADFSNFEVGDRVVCTKYSGTVGASAIEDYFYATITEVGEGYVQTSEETKVPTTGWKYLINQTVFDGEDYTKYCRFNSGTGGFKGIGLTRYNRSLIVGVSTYGYLYNCICLDNFNSISSYHTSKIEVFESAIINIPANYNGMYGDYGPGIYANNTVFSGVSATGSYGIIFRYGCNSGLVQHCGFFNLNYAIYSSGAASVVGIHTTHIDPTVTYGAYGYNITLVNCTNNAATPVYNLTSGGSIEEWDGQALPSIDDATGGQVLALKSDKSALEFATVLSSYTLPTASADTLGGVKIGSGITITDGVISIELTNVGYSSVATTATLPANPDIGEIYEFIGTGENWTLTANTGQYIRMLSVVSAAGGTIASTSAYDCVCLIYIGSNVWLVKSAMGVLEVT